MKEAKQKVTTLILDNNDYKFKSTGTVTLRAVFPNNENRIRPGQFLRLMLEGLTRVDALVVPQTAVMQDANGSYVYCLDKENAVKIVSVKTGLSSKISSLISDALCNK